MARGVFKAAMKNKSIKKPSKKLSGGARRTVSGVTAGGGGKAPKPGGV